MANVFKNFLDSLKLNDEDDDDYDDELNDFDLKAQERELKRAAKLERKTVKQNRDEDVIRDTTSYSSFVNDGRKDRQSKVDKHTSSKVVPIRTTPKGFEVSIMKPISFEDSQEICEMLLSGRATVINLEGLDVDIAQRIMDFASGCVYAINGKLHQISNYIFIVSPDNVDISGDYLGLLESSGFEVPTLNKEF